MVIDSHCHLHDPALPDALDTLRVGQSLDVWGVIAVGCDAETNARNLALAAAAPKAVWACLGFHPDQDRLGDADLDAVEQQVAEHHARIVGLGEVGLPWYSLEGKADAAERAARGRARLDRLLALAARYDLAVSLPAPHRAAAGALGIPARPSCGAGSAKRHPVAPPDGKRALVLHVPDVPGRVPGVGACHGLSASKESDKFLLLAGALPGAGLALARFDFRGCGESSGGE